MKRTDDDLERLFGDAQLEPRRAFTRQLSGQLNLQNAPQKHGWFGRRMALAGGVLVLALLLVAVPLLRPTPTSKSVARTVLLKQLYARAMADELPQQAGDITFWDVAQTDSGGPAMTACNSIINDYNEHSLLFKKDNVTAMWTKASNGFSDMEYSDDADVPAFDTDALSITKNGQIKDIFRDAKLTDANGKALPSDATTALKDAGTYELYATQATLVKGEDGSIPGCPTQLFDLKIDAASGLFSEVDIYNGTVAPDKLVGKIQQTIKTDTGDFAAVEPSFDALGFKLAQAKTNSENNLSTVVNEAGGYEFWYRKAFFGKATLSEEKNSDGSTGVYAYHFAKQPKVKYRLYTAKAQNQEPKDLADLKSKAAANNWQVLDDENQSDILYPGYAGASTELYKVSDGTTEYIMFASGTPDVPYVYIEAPLGSGEHTTTDSIGMTSVQNDVETLSNVMVFTPGTTPPTPEG